VKINDNSNSNTNSNFKTKSLRPTLKVTVILIDCHCGLLLNSILHVLLVLPVEYYY